MAESCGIFEQGLIPQCTPWSKNLSGKYSQKLLDAAKWSATDAFITTSKRVTQKAAEATGYLIVII